MITCGRGKQGKRGNSVEAGGDCPSQPAAVTETQISRLQYPKQMILSTREKEGKKGLGYLRKKWVVCESKSEESGVVV